MVMDSTPPYGVGVYEDAKARLKHQTLMQEYQELQKEVEDMRSKLDSGKQRKMLLAAEVRFLRRKYEYFMITKTINASTKGKSARPRHLLKQTQHMKEFGRTGASRHMLPPIPESKRKKKQYMGKVSLRGTFPVGTEMSRGGKDDVQHSSTVISNMNPQGRIDAKKGNSMGNTTLVLDFNRKERMQANEISWRNTFVAFDLNQDNNSSGKEASLPSRAPIFDLNEVSTGDEDFQSNVEAIKFEEAKRSIMRHPNDEVQNDLMLSVCRNAGDGSSCVGKRKISWHDPVALRA